MTRTRSRPSIRLVPAVLAAAAAFAAPSAAFAQEFGPGNGDPAPAPGDLAAETAYLRALFQEKEVEDFAKAEAAYQGVIGTAGAPRRIVARALVGRARCLLRLGRDDEAKALLAHVTAEFAAETDAAAEAERLAEPAPEAEARPLSDRIARALLTGSPRDTVVPYGDRAVPILADLIRGDEPRLAARAGDALVAIDTKLARESVRTLAAEPNLPFPREFARPIASFLPPADALALLRSIASPGARRAGYEMLARRPERLGDPECSAILADTEGRPPFAALNVMEAANGARLALAALASGDAALAREAFDALRDAVAAGQAPPGADVWLGARAEALADPAVRDLLVECVYTQFDLRSATETPSGALLREIAGHPAGARAVFHLYSSAPAAVRAASIDREAIRRSLAGRQPAGDVRIGSGFGRLLEAAGMTGPDDLRFLASHWDLRQPFAECVLEGPSNRRLDAASAAALLDPEHRPDVLVSCCQWIQQAAGRIEVAPEASVAVARLVDHPEQRVRLSASGALGKLASLGRVDPAVDPDRLLTAASSVVVTGGGGVTGESQALAAALAALPEEVRSRLLASRPTDVLLGWSGITSAIVGADAPEVERRLEEMVLGGPDPYVTAAATALLGRLGERAGPVLDRILAEVSTARAETVLRTLVATAIGRRVPFDVAGQTLERALSTHPGVLDLWHTPGATSRGEQIARAFPPEWRRRLARAALSSASEKDRRWGATEENVLRDGDAWDDLLRVAEDPDPDARNAARQALRAIDSGRREMEEFRARTEMRNVRARVEALLTAPEPGRRRAGIAAIVAVGSKEWLGELVRIAAEDADAGVRDAACAALLALGASVPSAAPADGAPQPARK